MQRERFLLLVWLPLLYLGASLVAIGAARAQLHEDGSAPHIAVLLPLKSSAFGRPADAVRRGLIEAQRVHPGSGLPLIVHATGDDPFDILQAYERALRDGAKLVIGPLTRSAVSALAGSNLVAVPTLALNAPEVDVVLPANLYLFGLQVENEAKQLAQLAIDQGRRSALVVVSETALSKRISQAFIDEFTRSGGQIAEQFQYTTESGNLMRLRDSIALGGADLAFLALDAQRAKLIRSFLGNALPVYATSLVNTGSDALASVELNGVFFVDMPWLLTPDHPAVLSYARPEQIQATTEAQRFYALGIDAYRLAQELLRPDTEHPPLDGVTGYITLDRDRRLLRELIPAQFLQGQLRVLAETVPR
jgi:outer membrane PBP1 activator LpoA protein